MDMSIYSNKKRALIITYTSFVIVVLAHSLHQICITQKRCIKEDPNKLSQHSLFTNGAGDFLEFQHGHNTKFEGSITSGKPDSTIIHQGLISVLWDVFSRVMSISDSHIFAEKVPIYTYMTSHFLEATSVLSGQQCQESIFSCLRKMHLLTIRRYLEFETAQIILSLWYGSGQTTGSEISILARNAGLSHLFAPSGLHLNSSIATISLLSGIILARKKLITIYIMGVLLFVGLVGVLPSLLRAAMYHILGYLYSLTGRSVSSQVRLVHSVMITVLMMPGMLISVGYQLSVVATVGLILIAPYTPSVSRLFLDSLSVSDSSSITASVSSDLLSSVLRYVLDMSLIGVTAQLVTLPLVWYYFNEIQPIGILFSLAFLWMIPILVQSIVWSVSSTILGFLLSSSLLDQVIMTSHVIVLQPVLKIVAVLLSFVSNLLDPVTLPEISWVHVIGMYLMLGLMYLVLRLRLQNVSNA